MENKLQEMQILEQNLQQMVYQKQAFQMELSETISALKEIEKSSEGVFKVIGQLMIKKEKSEIEKELKEKEKILKLRVESIEKQETPLREKLEKIREELMEKQK
jgi:prefoldin beta subunit